MTKRAHVLTMAIAICSVDPAIGAYASELGNGPRRLLLKLGLLDLDGERVTLTESGEWFRELAIELAKAKGQIERMVQSGLAQAVSPTQATEKTRIPRAPAHLSCGTQSTTSFDAFIANLEAAGRNRWKDPHYTGEGPARGRISLAQKDDDHGKA